MPRPWAFAATGLALLSALIVPQAATASGCEGEEGYFCCARPITDVVQDAVDDTTEFVEQVQRDTIGFAQKFKCSVLETAMICSSEETVPPGFPATTGYANAHRDRCYEYMITSTQCRPGWKLRHEVFYDENGERHEGVGCVPIYCGFYTDAVLRALPVWACPWP